MIRNIYHGVPNPYNTWQLLLPENIPNSLAKKIGDETELLTLEADLIVLSAGVKSDNSLYLEVLKENIAKELFNIGDSFTSRRVLEVNRVAFRLAQII